MRNKAALPLLAFGAGVLLAYGATRRNRLYDLKNKNVLITGGSRGLGFALAREFALRGSHVTVCARDANELREAANLLERDGLQINTMTCDITQEADVEALVRELETKNGPVDVLVNNAGRIEVGPLETTTIQDYEKAMATHFWGPLFFMQAALPGMVRQDAGRIVNISSIGGKIGVPHLTPYSGSKFALAGLSEAVAAEVRKNNIFVTTVYPGLMRTGSPCNANFKGQHHKEYTWFTLSDSTPLITIAAVRAARKIVHACQSGRASLVITPAAKLAVLAHALMPETLINALSLVNRLLPKAGGIGSNTAKGRDSQTLLTRSPLTILTKRAAAELNQMSGT
ncbi:MAG TPA: SDR family oxidoreductase [Candidatus Angelobacter sp.]|nr:SDR family oxidoreductase [Candidatus Angelobacter sp.]